MKMLSEKMRDIVDGWVIASGRYVRTGPMNQRGLSTKGDRDWSIAMPRALGRHLGEGKRMTPSEAQTRSELTNQQIAQSGWNVKGPTQVVEEFHTLMTDLSPVVAEPRTPYEGPRPALCTARQRPQAAGGGDRSQVLIN